MDASAIMQNDATIENLKAMTDFTREYGVYRAQASSDAPPRPPEPRPAAPTIAPGKIPAGVCLPWEQKLKELPPLSGDPALCRKIWEDVDSLAYLYIWHMVLSF